MSKRSLYERLGGYDGIVLIVDEFMLRIRRDEKLGRFYRHRGDDGVARERQLLIEFLCAGSGGAMYYRGRDMASAHKGMKISKSDWSALESICADSMAAVDAAPHESKEVSEFIASFKREVVEA